MKSKEIIEEKYKKVFCSKCSSSSIKKDGKRKTQNRGKIQRYRCKDCNFRFVIDDGFYRMRNHSIERLHNTIRERTKTMRDFHGCIESAYAIMKGLEINYNFNRKHMALGNKTPSEVAIRLELGVNKWRDLIKLSKL